MVKGKQTIELGGRYPDEVLLDGLLEVLDVRIPFGEVYGLEGVISRAEDCPGRTLGDLHAESVLYPCLEPVHAPYQPKGYPPVAQSR